MHATVTIYMLNSEIDNMFDKKKPNAYFALT